MVELMQALGPRLLRNGPNLVSLLLGALLLEECVRAIMPLTPQHPSAARPTAPGRALAHRPATVDVRRIVAAHLFGERAEDSPDMPAPSSTHVKLTLAGTLATENPRHGIAIIAAEGPARVYRVGDEVEGASLHAVYLDRVVLERSGRSETLTLPRLASADDNAGQRAPRAGRTVTAMATQSPEPVAERKLSDVMHAEPALDDQSDSLLGFRIRAVAKAPAFIRAGLRPGDLLIAVNGTQLVAQDRQRSQDVVDTMLASDRADVSIVRNGKPLDLSVDVSQ